MPEKGCEVVLDCTGIVLAGGESRRMGKDKALLPWGERNLLENAILILQPFCCDLIISSGNPAHHFPGALRVSDEFPGIGPMSGIYSCLNRSRTEDNLVIAADMPGLSADILRFLLHQGQGYKAAVFIRPEGMLEPLCGYYHREILGAMAKFIKRGEYTMHSFIASVRTRLVKTEELPGLNTRNMFLNLNDHEEYESHRP